MLPYFMHLIREHRDNVAHIYKKVCLIHICCICYCQTKTLSQAATKTKSLPVCVEFSNSQDRDNQDLLWRLAELLASSAYLQRCRMMPRSPRGCRLAVSIWAPPCFNLYPDSTNDFIHMLTLRQIPTVNHLLRNRV
jgi:hypothetical protein